MKAALPLLALAVYLLHQDYWNWTDKSLVFGFIPLGLAYHAGYSILASLLMWALVRYAWPHELESIEQQTSTSGESAQ